MTLSAAKHALTFVKSIREWLNNKISHYQTSIQKIQLMKLAVVSLNSIWEDKQANLEEVGRIVQSLNQKAEYIIFPEMSLTGFSVSNLALAEDFENSNSIRAIQKLAKEHQMNIVFGLMISKDDKNNSCVAVNDKGEITGL
jgi:predicted amidohydrolase